MYEEIKIDADSSIWQVTITIIGCVISAKYIPNLIGRPIQNIMIGKAMVLDSKVKEGSKLLK